LNDLKVKRSALDYFDIPISILDGRIGRIEMEIPWTQLLSFNVSPVVVTIKDVNIVLQPRMCVPWDPEREETVNYNVKKKKLEHHEQFETLRSSWRNNTDQDQTWSGKLAEAFGGNLQLRIENVHIRYEDLSNRRHPVVFGITLDSFVLEDLEAEDHVFSKNLNLNGFAFYGNLNRKQTLIGLLLKRYV
jgi:vacuolar protein sorting-associated protein 13A/C